MNQQKNEEIIEKFKTIRLYYDKLYITFAGSLWIFSTLWDIYKLQRYWLDFSMEFYSSILLFYMIIFSINPKSLPLSIYNSFSIITTIKGRGITLILISLLFLKDKHAFHKFCAIILLIGGVLYIICEILVPTTKEELNKIELMFKKETTIDNNKKIPSEKNTDDKIQIDKSIQQLDQTNNKINDKTEDNNNNKEDTDIQNIEEKNTENDKQNNNTNNEIVMKTDNPYELPEDF